MAYKLVYKDDYFDVREDSVLAVIDRERKERSGGLSICGHSLSKMNSSNQYKSHFLLVFENDAVQALAPNLLNPQ